VTLRDFLPNYKLEDLCKVYGATGGIPFYIQEFNSQLTFNENIRHTFFDKSNILHEDAEILLKMELREVSTYFNIMKAMINGATSLSEIASKSKVDITNINKYLWVLMNLGFVKKEYPITGPPKLKNFLYVLNDNYLRFWLRYVYPYKEEIEEDVDSLLSIMEDDYPNYMGLIFEDILRQLLRTLGLEIFSTPGAKIGRWWHKNNEIDIIALNENTKQILFGECKWKTKVDAKVILKKLKRTAKCVIWFNDCRKEDFIIFAKSFQRKTKECLCFDLSDLERVISASPRN
jgi:hypothetical protein